MKIFGLILLAEEISKEPTIDSVGWLLVVNLIKIYNEKEQTEQGDKQIKKWNQGYDDLRARSHPAKFLICEKELKNKKLRALCGSTSL